MNLGVKNSSCFWGVGYRLIGKGYEGVFWGDDDILDFDNYLYYIG